MALRVKTALYKKHFTKHDNTWKTTAHLREYKRGEEPIVSAGDVNYAKVYNMTTLLIF